MTTKQRIKARQDRNRELARIDSEHRCAFCKRNLSETGVIIEDFLVDGKFCSDMCLEQAKEKCR